MFLSKRERTIAVVTVVAVAMLLLDRYALTPILDRRAQLDADRQRVESSLAQAGALFGRKKHLGPRWRRMVAAGLDSKPADAESRVLHAMRDWSHASGLVLTSLKPEGTPRSHGLLSMNFRASGTGGMRAVAGFLWRLQTASLPVRVNEVQIGSRKAGKDDLTLQIRLSSLCVAADPTTDAHTGAGQAGKERRR